MKILWLRPTKPDNISVGRERVASVLQELGDEVTIRDASKLNAVGAIVDGLRGDYDVVVGTVRMGLYVGAVISLLDRTPLLADVTDPIEQVSALPASLYRAVESLETNVLRYADECVFLYTSSYERARFHGIDGVKLDNGVNFEQFADPDSNLVGEARELLSDEFDTSKWTAVYVGGLEPEYHISLVLDVARQLDDWNFIFAGDGTLSGDVVEATHSADNVFYPGSLRYELVPGLLAHADVGLCLIDAEQPLKVLEYGAAGIATVALAGELEQRFPAGSICYTRPMESAVTETLRTLGNSPDLRRSYAEALRDAAQEYSWDEIGKQYRELLLEICH